MENERRTLVFEQERDRWIGYAPELPGTYARGSTLAEVRENLSEAVRLASRADSQQGYHGARAKEMLAATRR